MVARVAVFLFGELLGAAAFATLLAFLGSQILPPRTPVETGALGTAGAAVLLRETIGRRIPVPERNWQVPRHWLAAFWRGSFIFGSIMGIGALTKQPSTLFHLYLIACFASADPAKGAVLGAAFGTTYAILFVYGTIAWRSDPVGTQSNRTRRIFGAARYFGAFAAPLVILVPF